MRSQSRAPWVLVLLTVILLVAPPTVRAQAAADTSRSGYRGLVAGGGYLLAAPQGSFGRTVGGLHGGLHLFVGVQGARWSAGIDVDGFTYGRVGDRVALPSGPSVELNTTTDASRISLYGRFGPRLGLWHPFAEATAGVQVFETRTRLAGGGSEPGGMVSARSTAPSVGVGIGLMAEADGWPFGWFVRARVATGGRATYFVFDDDAERFEPRSSGTTSVAVSAGVFMYPF